MKTLEIKIGYKLVKLLEAGAEGIKTILLLPRFPTLPSFPRLDYLIHLHKFSLLMLNRPPRPPKIAGRRHPIGATPGLVSPSQLNPIIRHFKLVRKLDFKLPNRRREKQ